MSKRKRVPTKAELLQLQKLYKTDERIGERLGGVPAYLVAYWRRKKNIPKYSLPKFSEQEIQNLWERFGDDEKAGLELGISKAAFYNWRRRYGFREKPAFLKLEQLELNFPGSNVGAIASALYGQRTIAQKIIARIIEEENVDVGDSITLEPDLVTINDRPAEIIDLFKKSSEYVWNSGKIASTMSLSNGDNGKNNQPIKTINEFVKRQGVKNIYQFKDGTSPQVLMEKGHILPGQLLITDQSHISPYGSLSTLTIRKSPEAIANVLASGEITIEVPDTVKLTLIGRKPRSIQPEDIALSTISAMKNNTVEDKVIELSGSIISQMSISERFTLISMMHQTNACAALTPYDSTVRRYLTGRAVSRSVPIIPDKDAIYSEYVDHSVDSLKPQIFTINTNSIEPVVTKEGSAVQQVIIGSCNSGRFDQLRTAADILKGKQVHPNSRLYIIPGSRATYLEALKKGLIRAFIEAGGMVLFSNSCPCTADSVMIPEAGETCLITGDSHHAKRLLKNSAEVCLTSTATAAVSALQGEITDPTRFVS